ncbi:hypothetical protein ScPMuIL_018602 [Solemya velum]
MSELKTVSIVLFIAAGALLFILLFFFGKRQITRFTLKSARRPHVSIGSGTPKKLKREIQQRLEKINHIKYEPQLLNDKLQTTVLSGTDTYFYRMKAIDAFSRFDYLLKSEIPEVEVRHPSQPVHFYLLNLHSSYLSTSSTDLIQQFADSYEHARHKPGEFGERDYRHFMDLLEELIMCAKVGIQTMKMRDTDNIAAVNTEVMFSSENNHSTSKIAVKVTSPQPQKGAMGQTKCRSRVSTTGSEYSGITDSGHSSHQSVVDGNTENIDKLQLIKQSSRKYV